MSYWPRPTVTRWDVGITITPANLQSQTAVQMTVQGKFYQARQAPAGSGHWIFSFAQPPLAKPANGIYTGALQIGAPDGYVSQDLTVAFPGNNTELSRVDLQPVTVPGPVPTGVLRVSGKAWEDDAGHVRPLGQTLFWAPWGLVNGQEARLRQAYAYLRSYRFTFIRQLGQVAWPQLADPPFVNGQAIYIRPSDPGYADQMARAIDVPYDEYGLRTHLSIYGEYPVSTDPAGWTVTQTAEVLRDVISSRRHKLHSLEMTNEGHLSWAEMVAMADVLAPLGLPMAPTSPATIDEGSAWIRSGHGFDHMTPRLDRNNWDADWRFPRQVSDFRNQPYAFNHNEPQGPASSIAQTNDPLRLALGRAVSMLCGGGSWLLHNAAGVNGFADPSRGRTANIWEMPNIDAVMDAVGTVEGLLPDVVGWQTTSQSGTNPGGGQVLTSDAIWSDGADHGVSRNYGANGPGSFVQAPMGVDGYARFRANQACRVKAYEPLSGTIVWQGALNSGETFDLPGTPRDGNTVTANAAYILTGEY